MCIEDSLVCLVRVEIIGLVDDEGDIKGVEGVCEGWKICEYVM